MFPGLDLYQADGAQHLVTAGHDLDDLARGSVQRVSILLAPGNCGARRAACRLPFGAFVVALGGPTASHVWQLFSSSRVARVSFRPPPPSSYSTMGEKCKDRWVLIFI